MQNPSAAKKTALAPKKILVGALVAALIVTGFLAWRHAKGTTLQVAGHAYTLEVAQTEQQQEKGLGDRNSMSTNHGMLFTYAKSGKYCYWMKGMRFPLDIIWLDAQKRVVKIEQNLSPKTYPEAYCPDTNAQYVIELNTGQAALTHMHAGQQLKF
jgi:uncharacterized membrane protein (UPF0127 family)